MEATRSSMPVKLCRQFSLDEILSATQDFNDALVVGEGGFGKVYKATINVANGATFIVAIKRLDSSSSQGALEFWAEVEMLTKLRHCNLVSLIGYCNDNSEMILIYQYMPNGTLDGHLHKYGTQLSWVQRLKISIGAARGLHYLHTGTGTQHGVIHRDVKSSNILLDEDYAAKISDFGLSKIGPTNTSGAYVNTLVRGTFGYLDPEYFLTGRLTRKSDVFAFGVVLFELLCGRAALDSSLDEDECSLVKWAHESIAKGKLYEIIHLNIKSQISPKCLKVFVQIADRCLTSESRKRPTMAEILVALELSLTLQNKFDSRVKPTAGMMSIARVIQWPFMSSKVDSAQTKSLDKGNINHAPSSKEHMDDQLEVFSFDDIESATRGFTCTICSTCTGTTPGGNFWEVYEGWLKTNALSLRIAVRRLHLHDHLKKKSVIERLLSEFNHPNLVKVLGYCFHDEQVFLIYEFMENGCLDSHLFSKNKIPISWKTRVQIAKGIAEALSFLHRTHPEVQNRPLDLHNILLDKNFNAKISNYESAKLVHGDSFVEISDDPLYYFVSPEKTAHEGIVRPFGVVLFQLLTGKRNIANLQRYMSKESLRRALDPRLPNVDDTIIQQAMKLADVASNCFDDAFYTLNKALNTLGKL